MIASVITTRRAGRPIDFHIPTRLKSIGVYFSSGVASRIVLWLDKRRQNLHRRTLAVNAACRGVAPPVSQRAGAGSVGPDAFSAAWLAVKNHEICPRPA